MSNKYYCSLCKNKDASFVVYDNGNYYCIPCYEANKPSIKNKQTKLF